MVRTKSMDELNGLRLAVLDIARFLGYSSMKEKQIKETCAYTEGHDTLESLPTGYYHFYLTKSEVRIIVQFMIALITLLNV